MQTVDYSYTCCDIVESVCLSVCLCVGYTSEWALQKRLNRLRIRDAMLFEARQTLVYVGLCVKCVQMGAIWRVWLNGLCTVATLGPISGINLKDKNIPISVLVTKFLKLTTGLDSGYRFWPGLRPGIPLGELTALFQTPSWRGGWRPSPCVVPQHSPNINPSYGLGFMWIPWVAL